MEIVRLMRPWQWVKNLFVFLPMFFSGHMGDWGCWIVALIGFCAMCLVASSIYCLNDIVDVEENRNHPRKRFRPVAKGSVSVRLASIASLLLTAGGGAILFMLPSFQIALTALALVGSYYVMNCAYCLFLKRIAIVDVFCISTGFVLRIFVGGMVCGIWISPWLVCLTFLLTLFLAFAKRRDDILMQSRDNVVARKSASQYNMPFMNQTLGLLGAITVVCYILYTVQPEVEERLGTEWVYLTSVFVLAGILRYLQIAIVDEKSGDPTSILLKDRFIQGCVLLWSLSYMVIIYI
ncbi:MAG: UbiA prenyltransferase family protein [Muribaculaceae bacterium]|nr:UbiA prenyltransferase family protein [Muribaculaceae bacterium]